MGGAYEIRPIDKESLGVTLVMTMSLILGLPKTVTKNQNKGLE